MDQPHICNQNCVSIRSIIPLRGKPTHTACTLKQEPTTVGFGLLTYSSSSQILAGNSRGTWLWSFVKLHIPFRLFLSPLDTLQTSLLHTGAACTCRLLFQGTEGTLQCSQRISAVLQGIKHLAHETSRTIENLCLEQFSLPRINPMDAVEQIRCLAGM